MPAKETPINRSRAVGIRNVSHNFGAGTIIARVNGVTFYQLQRAFGKPYIDKGGEVYGNPRRYFWSLKDDEAGVLFVIASDSPDEKQGNRWKIGVLDREGDRFVRGILTELFAPQYIEIYDPPNRVK